MLRRQLTTGTSGWVTGEASDIGNTSAVGPSISGVDPLIKKRKTLSELRNIQRCRGYRA